MNSRFFFIAILLCVSCSTIKETKPNPIVQSCKPTSGEDELEVTLDHLKAVIRSQKGIEPSSKIRFLKLTESAVASFKELRNEELEILRILISKSVRYKSLSQEDVKSKNYYVKRLDQIYVEKERNILKVIDELIKVTVEESEKDKFENEMIQYLKPLL